MPAYETHHRPLETLPFHRHVQGYAALVLDGGYEELTMDGRFTCQRGCLIIHPEWHAHGDEFGSAGAIVLNLPVARPDGFSVLQVSNVDQIEGLARSDPEEAGQAALEEARIAQPLSPSRWLVKFVLSLMEGSHFSIEQLAFEVGVSPEHASRACKRWFGLGPVELRREKRLQLAIRALREGASPGEAAYLAGFSDQPHLTRLLKKATGFTPARFPQN